jgi:hypothetical protein
MLAGRKPSPGPAPGTRRLRRWWVDLEVGRLSARVELRRLVAVRIAGRDVVRLDDLWSAGHLGVPATDLAFDFFGDDGTCVRDREPGGIPWRALSTGFMCVVTRDLLWQPTPQRPASWGVRAVARIVAFSCPNSG